MAQGVGAGSPKKARAFCGAARARGPASSECPLPTSGLAPPWPPRRWPGRGRPEREGGPLPLTVAQDGVFAGGPRACEQPNGASGAAGAQVSPPQPLPGINPENRKAP